MSNDNRLTLGTRYSIFFTNIPPFVTDIVCLRGQTSMTRTQITPSFGTTICGSHSAVSFGI